MTGTATPRDRTERATPDATLLVFQTAAPIVTALTECDEALRGEVLELFAQLQSGDLDEYARHATAALIADILFPNADDRGRLGIDLFDAERVARAQSAEAAAVLDTMDREEEHFAARVRAVMDARRVTQAELAEKIGVGQPAVAMMLARQCRPQKKTVRKIAAALGVPAGELWPGLAD